MKDTAERRNGIEITAAQLCHSARTNGRKLTQERAVQIVRQANLNVERDQTRKG